MPTTQQAALAVVPLPRTPSVHGAWSAHGLPESGLIMLLDTLLCPDCTEQHSGACGLACAEAHGFPTWSDELRPHTCLQCVEPSCAEVCPVDAIAVNALGAVTLDQELCIGCRFCEEACPEGALLYVEALDGPAETEPVPYTSDRPDGSRLGTVAKCTLCTDRLQSGKLPVCLEACPNHAIYLGNLDRNTVTNGVTVTNLAQLLETRHYTAAANPKGVATRIVHLA